MGVETELGLRLGLRFRARVLARECMYKYLLNSPSIGYANKLKSLLLCGSVVLYVRDGMRHKEFYEYGLVSGIHYVAVDTAEDVPAMVR